MFVIIAQYWYFLVDKQDQTIQKQSVILCLILSVGAIPQLLRNDLHFQQDTVRQFKFAYMFHFLS